MHTPGPWTLYIHKDGGNWDYQIRTVKPHNPAGELGKHIADVNKYLAPEENGRLLAASPDLLDALIAALPYIECAMGDPCYKPGAVAKIVKQMQSAIAKAEG